MQSNNDLLIYNHINIIINLIIMMTKMTTEL